MTLQCALVVDVWVTTSMNRHSVTVIITVTAYIRIHVIDLCILLSVGCAYVYKKLSYRREAVRCLVLLSIFLSR